MEKFFLSIKDNIIYIGERDDTNTCLSLEYADGALEITRAPFSDTIPVNCMIDGLLGVYSLSNAIYLAVVTKSVEIGKSVLNNPIYQVEKVEFVKVPSPKTEVANSKYLSMIQNVYSSINLYFSYHEDLTRRLEDTLCEPFSEEDRVYPRTVNTQFLFNYPIIQQLETVSPILPKDLLLKPIFGFIKIVPHISIHDITFSLTLISRRSIYRNGRRYNTRGVDEEGNVANFVETEQIVKTNCDDIYSHVQIRGSIPLEWTQKPTMKYTPAIHISDNLDSFNHHFDKLVMDYGKIVVVNLIDKKKDQLKIGSAFENACTLYNQDSNCLEYHWFDFHAECKGMHFENVRKLLDETSQSVREGSFFHYNLSIGCILEIQNSVLRTNCIDCLDRTNVVQSEYAKDILFTQLFKEKAKEEKDYCFKSSKHDIFKVFNNLWSDNADQMSLFYSSSRSLKTDYTRTGKRTKMGALMDGVNSVIRYFNNNFCDGYFEDCLNLTFNQVEICEETDKLVIKEKSNTAGSFVVVVMTPVSAACYLLSLLAEKGNENVVFWSLSTTAMAALAYTFVKKGCSFGRTFVSRAILPKKH